MDKWLHRVFRLFFEVKSERAYDADYENNEMVKKYILIGRAYYYNFRYKYNKKSIERLIESKE